MLFRSVQETVREQESLLVEGPSPRHIGKIASQRTKPMQSRNTLFDDMSKLMTNAMGVAQGAKTEAETAMKSLVDRWMADREFVTREEFEVVRAMAMKAREENLALQKRIEALEAGKSAE